MIRHIVFRTPHGSLHGQLERPENPRGLILAIRSHRSPEDDAMLASLAASGFAILAMDLLTAHELQFADATQNVPRLAQRLLDVLELIRNDGDMQDLALGIHARSDTTPAAVRCTAQRDIQVKALVCHGGLVDRAGLQALELLAAPLLMLVDQDDIPASAAYQRAASHLSGKHLLRLLAAGDHRQAEVAAWFAEHLSA